MLVTRSYPSNVVSKLSGIRPSKLTTGERSQALACS